MSRRKSVDVVGLGPYVGEVGGVGVSTARVVEWVFENVSVAYVDQGSCPSAGAWGLLDWVRSDPSNLSEFYRIWSKLLPTKQQIDNQTRFEDDGRRQFELLGRLEREFLRDGTEGGV